MKASTHLKRARRLIADPAHWTQGAMARKGNMGLWDTADWSEADSFCSVGALRMVKSVPDSSPPFAFLRRAMDNCDIAWFNDTSTHAKVLAAFDTAIKNAVRSEQRKAAKK